jgi:hypothetical protein
MGKSHLAAIFGCFAFVAAWKMAPDEVDRVGLVTSADGPVSGAVVRAQGQCALAKTDEHGEFRFCFRETAGRPITAWKQGYSIGHAPAGGLTPTIDLTPLPGDHDDYEWISPEPDPKQVANCGNCHAEIYRQWAQSAHGRASTNPRVLEAFTHAARDRPGGAGVCAKCHAPTMRDPEIDYDLRLAKGVDRLGVHCDYCHKVQAAPEEKFGTRFGTDALSLLRPPPGTMLFFGPLDDAVREGESFAYSRAYKDSRYCAACHEGVVFGTHAYATYSEWLESPARRQGKQCQNCHQAPSGTMTNIAPGHGGVERRPDTLASHTMPGGTLEMLRSCLELSVQITGPRVDVVVRASQAGHRVPTGFPERHLVLSVQAYAAKNACKLTSGPVLPTRAGDRAMQPGKLFARHLAAPTSETPVEFWQLPIEREDTRLRPGTADRTAFIFQQAVQRAQVKLIYRRHWPAASPTARGMRENAEELLIIDRIIWVK